MKSSLKFIMNSCIILAVAPLFAATINVPSDQATFAAAVAAAQNGDTIVLDDGTFTLAADLAIAVRVTITSRTNKDASIIDTKGKNFKFQASGCVLDKVTVVNSASGNSYNPSAGLHVNATGCCISNCVFRQIGNNLGDNARWSIYCDKADTTISGCILTNNYNQYAPGISIAGGLVENCLIADNRSKKYSSNYPNLALAASGATIVRNCTIVGNALYYDTGSVPAVVLKHAKGMVVENNIIWGNTNGKTSPAPNNWSFTTYRPIGTPYPDEERDCSCWTNNCTTGAGTIDGQGGSGNFEADPLFKDDGFSLRGVSPCIGKADTCAPAADVFGRPRPAPASLGAVEYVAGDSMEVGLTASGTSVFTPESVTLTALVAGTFTEPLSYAFDLDNDGTADVIQNSSVLSLSAVGAYRPCVTVTDASSPARTETAACADEIVIYDAAKVVYVDAAAAAPAKPYMSRATATPDIATAVGICPIGGTVVIAPGTYTPAETIFLSKSIAVRGESDAGEVVVRPSAGIRSFWLTDAAAELSGVTVEGRGQAYASGAMIYLQSGGIVSNCVLRNVSAGVYMNNSLWAEAGLVTGCVVTNIANNYNCGIYATGSAIVENCLVAACSSRNEAAVNSAARLGCALNLDGSVKVRNCTIAGNALAYSTKDSGYNTPAVYVTPGFSGKIENCVFADNTCQTTSGGAYVATNDVAFGASVVRYCAVKDAQADYTGYAGMVTAEPTFKAGTWMPAAGSVLIDAGDNTVEVCSPVDLAGRKRRVGTIDIGCYESQSAKGLILLVR